jgi:hypothetical protein
MRPAESLPRSAAQHGKKELSGRREQLVEAIAAAKERLRRVDHEVVRASVEPQIEALEREVKRIESAIAEALSNDETTRSTAAIFGEHPRGRKVVQAGDDGVHAEAAGADEHVSGSRPGVGPIARDLISDSKPRQRGAYSPSDASVDPTEARNAIR